MIITPAWLAELAARGPKEAKAATKIVRAQVVLFNRAGHLLDLISAPIRHAVAHSAAYGAVTDSPCRCSNCNAVAPLTRWVDLSQASRDYHLALALKASVSFRPHDYLYMQKCPGAMVAQAMAASDRAPSERRG